MLKAAQSGTVTLGVGTTTATATLTPVDTARAFLVFGVAESADNPADGHVSGQLTNATTVTFARLGGSGTITLRWHVAEFVSGVSVQRGSVDTTVGSPINVPLAAVDLTRSFPLISYRADGSNFNDNDFVRGKLTSGTNLELSYDAGVANTTVQVVEWQVVEYQDAAVQTGDLSFGALDTVRTATLSPAVDTSRAWLLFSYECEAPAGCPSTPTVGAKLVRGLLSNATTLTFDRGVAANETLRLTWYLVEFTDTTRVQRGSASFVGASNLATGSYTGDGVAGRAITGLGFQPNVVIVKANYVDAVNDDLSSAVLRTTTMPAGLAKPMKGSQGLLGNLVTSLDANGFTVGSDPRVNDGAALCGGANCTYFWVAFRADANLRVGSYTGSPPTLAITGLGFSPEYVIVASESTTRTLQRTTQNADSYQFWAGSSLPGRIVSLDADGFTVANTALPSVNANAEVYHYVAFNEVPGRMKVGSYVGTGANFRLVNGVGFQPAYVIAKGLAPSQFDPIQRSASMPGTTSIDFRQAGTTTAITALTADGFQLGTATQVNEAGTSYAYVAFGRTVIQDVALSQPVPPFTSIATAGNYLQGGSTPYAADDVPGVSWFSLQLTSSSRLRLRRGAALAAADVGWFVVSFPTAPALRCAGNLVMVTGDGAFGLGFDAAQRAFFEGLGYTVSAIAGNAPQATFDAAAAANDVMFISDTAQTAAGTAARGLAIAVVSENTSTWADLMYSGSGSIGSSTDTSVDVVDNTAYITARFPIGALTVHSPIAALGYWNAAGALPAGAQVLATRGANRFLIAFELGSSLFSGNVAADRRVLIGTVQTDPASWAANLQILLDRSLGWSTCAAATSVELLSFEATGVSGAVELEWRTASETDNLGFHVYRGVSPAGPWRRLTQALIPGQAGSPEGASYAWRDAPLGDGETYYYLLEDVDTSGRSERHGPVWATVGAGAGGGGTGEGGEGGGGGSGEGGEGGVAPLRFGDPDTRSLQVLARDAERLVVELVTGGFFATPDAGDGLRFAVPGFDAPAEPGLPDLPSRLAWLEGRAGRVPRIVSVVTDEVVAFPLTPAAAGAPTLRAEADGTVRAALRRVPARAAQGLFPAAPAALLDAGFQGSTAKLLLRLSPLRFDADSGQVLLARRLRVTLAFEPPAARELAARERGVDGTDARVFVPAGLDAAGVAAASTATLAADGSLTSSGLAEGAAAGAPQPQTPPAVLAQLVTRAEGLHSVGFEALFPTRRIGFDSAALRLARRDQTVGFRTLPDPARFEPGSTLLFLSPAPDVNPDANELVFVLSRDSGGKLIPEADASPLGPSVVELVASQGFETNRLYRPALVDAHDVWLWEMLLAPARKAFPFDLPGLEASSSTPARLELFLQGGSDFPASPDHRIRVFVNGTLLGETSFDGMRPAFLALDVPAALLLEKGNSLELENVGDTEATSSLVFLDRFALDYPQATRARGGVLAGMAPRSGSLALAGFSAATLPATFAAETVVDSGLGVGIRQTPQADAGSVDSAVLGSSGSGVDARPAPVLLLDTTAALPVWLTGARADGGVLRLRAQQGRRYLAVARDAVRAPEVRFPIPSGLTDTDTRAEWLVIAPRHFAAAAETLAAHRQGQGLTTRVAFSDEIRDHFGHGESHPQAFHDFIAFAFHRWATPPRYVLLLADASYDPKSFLGSGVASPIPSPSLRSSFLWTAADPLLAAVNGSDTLPDLALGRLSASSPAQALALVDKLVAWESSGFSLDQDAVLVSDNPDKGGDFDSDASAIAALLAPRDVVQIRLSALGRNATRAAIFDAFDQGASLLSYIGHGASTVWASENVLNAWDLDSLQPQPRHPFLLTLNCLNGYFTMPTLDSLAEAFVKAPDKGAIAAFSPSSMSLNDAAHVYHRLLVQELASAQHARLGDALLAAQSAYADSGAFPELLSVFHLLGDPATKIGGDD